MDLDRLNQRSSVRLNSLEVFCFHSRHEACHSLEVFLHLVREEESNAVGDILEFVIDVLGLKLKLLLQHESFLLRHVLCFVVLALLLGEVVHRLLNGELKLLQGAEDHSEDERLD